MGKFYKRFFAIYTVFVLQNVVTLGVNLTDNIMLGAYSEISLSGVAAVNQIQFIYQQVLTALGEGVVMFGSQYWGKGQTKPVKRIASAAMWCGLAVACLLFLAVSIFPRQVMRMFTTAEPIVAEGMAYINIIRFSYLFFALTMILLATLRSVEVVKIGFWLSVMTFAVNTVINYILIYGNFGAPRLGVQGAAIGTLTARILECSVLVLYIIRRECILKLKWRDYLIIDKLLCKDYFKVVTPMLGISGLWGVSTALQTVILGHMSAEAIAANSVASVLFLLVKGSAVGAASAAAIITGKTIGMGELDQVRQNSRRLQRLFLAIGIAGGLFLFFIRIPVLRLYDLSEETSVLASQFLLILSVVYVGMGYQMPTCEGIIRGGGNASYVVKLNLVSIWMIVLPVSFIMAFVVKASPVVVVWCLNADQLFKCIPVFFKANYGSWIRELTRKF